MDPRRTQPQYDPQKRSKATITAMLRAIVAFYLAYLGWTVCAVFTVVGILFGVYTMRRYQADLKAAELPREEKREDEDE